MSPERMKEDFYNEYWHVIKSVEAVEKVLREHMEGLNEFDDRGGALFDIASDMRHELEEMEERFYEEYYHREAANDG